MKVIDLPNVPGMKNTHIRADFLGGGEKDVDPPKYINKIVKDERSGLSMLNQLGTYDMIGNSCRSVNDTMAIYLGTGLRYNSSSVNATPLDPLSKLVYNKAREGNPNSILKSYDFTQKGNPLCGTYF